MFIYQDPEIADDVEIALLKNGSAKGIKAWAVSPYDYNAKIKEPKQSEINPKIVDGEVVLEVPPFKYFSLVIVRKKK